MKVLLAFLSAVALCAAFDACDTNDDCSATECCVEEDRFWIISKRDLPPPDIDIQPVWGSGNTKKGRCVSYMKERKSCHSPAFASCGCTPGTKCVFYPPKKLTLLPGPIKEIQPVGKRDFFERPGSSFCEK